MHGAQRKKIRKEQEQWNETMEGNEDEITGAPHFGQTGMVTSSE